MEAGNFEKTTCDKLPLKMSSLGSLMIEGPPPSDLPNKKARPSPSSVVLQFPQADKKPELLLCQPAPIGRRSHFDLKASGNDSSGTFHPKLPAFDAAHPSIVEGACSDDRPDHPKFQELKSLYGIDRADGISSSSQFDIASSVKGEVKISLSCCSTGNSNFRSRSLNAVLGKVEDECCRQYRIQDPTFSLKRLMEKVCVYFLEMENDCSSNGGALLLDKKNSNNLIPLASVLDEPNISTGKDLGFQDDCQGHSTSQPCHPSEEVNQRQQRFEIPSKYPNQGIVGGSERMIAVVKKPKPSNASFVEVVVKSEHPVYIRDIAKGKENVEIPLVNESSVTNLELPSFKYIKNNMVFNTAHVDFSLARISDLNCCARCYKDCLSSPLPCPCAAETRGEFAYTQEGLVKERFLDECISMCRQPDKKYKYYCEICPLRNDLQRIGRRVKPCEGHLTRRFIKECWYSCGCNKKCGNRVVQRGIQVKLQVFATFEGKGWGLRSVHALKKGTFVCEYAGEIVTNMELYERNEGRCGKQERHTYPVLLDADWGSERILKDEEALCLDATEFGNVGRFINHRCSDANLIEIPVEIETPDHHYYHLAFFTTRDIEPMEELTWDYGIRFDDLKHPVKAFKCMCGSKSCRDRKRVKTWLAIRGEMVEKENQRRDICCYLFSHETIANFIEREQHLYKACDKEIG